MKMRWRLIAWYALVVLVFWAGLVALALME